jgi:iron complex outermembrane receptor protein
MNNQRVSTITVFVATTASAVVATMPARGQEAGTQNDTTRDAADSGTIEEIVVTARKREESVQDVPISITAFSGDTLEARGITQIDRLAAITPNLVYQNNPGLSGAANSSTIFIRGVGQSDFLGSIDPGVGLYVDGVYIARSLGAVLDLLDVERVEVLRGPQGTLFGRNTIGGAVSLTSQKPDADLGGRATLIYGDDNRIEAKGMINVPLTDTVAVRLAASHAERDGFVKNVVDGAEYGNTDTTTGLLQLRWRPSDNLTIDVAFDATRDRSDGAPAVLLGADLTSGVFNPQGLPYIPPRSVSPYAVDAPVTPLPPPGGSAPGPTGPIAPGSIPFLPPGVDPNALYYELNVQQVPGAPPGTFAPFDVPTDSFTLLNNYLATFLGGQPCLSGAFEPYNPAPENANPACYGARYYESSLGENRVAGGLEAYSDTDVWGGAVTVDWQLGAVELVSITSYRELDAENQRDFDATPLVIAHFYDLFEQWQASQELQLKGSSFGDRLDWIVGAYYFKEKVDNLNDVSFTPVDVRSGGLIDNESTAIFTQGTYDVTDQLAITAGARYTKDEKTFEAGPYQFITGSRTPAFTAGTPTLPKDPATLESSEWTPYLNVAYRWTDDVMTYLSYSEGFKSGGFTQRVFPPLPAVPTVDPEFVKVYEVGFKTQTAGQRLRLNGAAFYTDYSDIQVQGFTLATGVAPIYINGPSASVQGFELEMQAVPGDDWYLEAGVGYLDDEYDELPEGVIGLDESKQFERLSEWTLNASVQKQFSLGGSYGALTPRVGWSYRSKFYNDSSNVEAIAQPSYSLWDASLGWRSDSGRWSLTANVDNIADEDYIVAASYNAIVRNYNVVKARGRQWSLRAQVEF